MVRDLTIAKIYLIRVLKVTKELVVEGIIGQYGDNSIVNEVEVASNKKNT